MKLSGRLSGKSLSGTLVACLLSLASYTTSAQAMDESAAAASQVTSLSATDSLLATLEAASPAELSAHIARLDAQQLTALVSVDRGTVLLNQLSFKDHMDIEEKLMQAALGQTGNALEIEALALKEARASKLYFTDSEARLRLSLEHLDDKVIRVRLLGKQEVSAFKLPASIQSLFTHVPTYLIANHQIGNTCGLHALCNIIALNTLTKMDGIELTGPIVRMLSSIIVDHHLSFILDRLKIKKNDDGYILHELYADEVEEALHAAHTSWVDSATEPLDVSHIHIIGVSHDGDIFPALERVGRDVVEHGSPEEWKRSLQQSIREAAPTHLICQTRPDHWALTSVLRTPDSVYHVVYLNSQNDEPTPEDKILPVWHLVDQALASF